MINALINDLNFSKGFQLMDEGKWTDAVDYFNQLINNNHYVPYASLYKSYALMELNELAESENAFESANQTIPNIQLQIGPLAENSNSPTIILSKSFYLMEKKSYSEAIIQCNNIIQLNSYYTLSYYLKGDALKSQKRFELSIQNFDTILKQNRKSLLNLYGKGCSLLKLGCMVESLEILKQVCKDSPLYKKVYYSIVKALEKQEKYQESIYYLDMLIIIKKNELSAIALKGKMLLMIKDYQRAIQYFKQALELSKTGRDNVSFYLGIGKALLQLNQFSESIIVLNQALEIDASQYQVLWLKSQALFELEQFQESQLFCDLVIDIRPDFIEIQILKAKILFNLTGLKDAIKYLDYCLSIVPNEGAAICLRAQYLLYCGEFQLAFTHNNDYLETREEGYEEFCNQKINLKEQYCISTIRLLYQSTTQIPSYGNNKISRLNFFQCNFINSKFQKGNLNSKFWT